ncbi:MAG: L,D-transpeptidase family protein [Anaerolineales bacterium]
MNTKFIEARDSIAKARQALRRGDKESARQLGERAALVAPEMEDAWLVLAASDPNPQDALAYAQKALEINPESTRAHRGVEWALGRLKQSGTSSARVATEGSGRNDAIASLPKRVYREVIPSPELKINRQNWLYPVLLIGAGCIVVGFVALFALTRPALASLVGNVSAPVTTQENLWAPVDIAKPTITPIDVGAFAPQVANTPASAPSDAPTSLSTDLPTSVPTDMPTLVPTEAPTFTPEATQTPGTMAMEIIADTPTSQYAPPVEVQAQYPAEGSGARWIDVNLSEQRVYAYEGDVVVNSFLVSTGTWRTPTVTGKYPIWIKVRVQDMSGPGYYLPDVPHVMFFYKGYGFHGTYWHNNFGTPMSHGCVNLTVDDAAWLYNWASVGTVVNVHY